MQQDDIKTLNKISYRDLEKYLQDRKIELMKSLSDKRVLGFKLSFTEVIDGHKNIFPCVRAYRSIKGKKLIFNLGQVVTEDEAMEKIKDGISRKIDKAKTPEEIEILEMFLFT